jgi:nitrogen fixation NifU-like protein
MAYSEKLLKYYEDPKNVGSLDEDDKQVGTGLVGNPKCGDIMKLQIKVSDDGVIADAKFKTFGCGAAIASTSLATEKLIGMKLEDALKLKNKDISDELELPPIKIHCSVLTEEAVSKAIADYKEKNGL